MSNAPYEKLFEIPVRLNRLDLGDYFLIAGHDYDLPTTYNSCGCVFQLIASNGTVLCVDNCPRHEREKPGKQSMFLANLPFVMDENLWWVVKHDFEDEC